MLVALTTLLTFSLAGGQDGQLAIANAHPTYGYLGAPRPAKEGRLPGDVAHFFFEIRNLKLDAEGRAFYSIGFEIRDDKGRVVYKEKPHNATAQNFLGGNSLQCSTHMDIPLDTPPGVYTSRLTVHDRAADKTVHFEGKAEVLAKTFGLVRVGTFSDREGKVPTPPVGVLGESVYVNFSAVGFVRDKKKHPHVEVSMRLLDDKGTPTFAKPLSGKVIEDVPEDQEFIPMQFGVTLNRVGRFTVELTATDKLSGKSSKVSFPLKVLE